MGFAPYYCSYSTMVNIIPTASLLIHLLLLISAGGCQASPIGSVNLHSRPRIETERKVHPTSIPRGGLTSSLPTWTNKVISGGVSRALAQALLYPVDALRTLAQTRDGRTLADVGSKALVRGCAQTSSFALLTGGLQFGIFGAINPKYGPLVASACGAAGSCLVSVPQVRFKT